jgi:hypothetical protein
LTSVSNHGYGRSRDGKITHLNPNWSFVMKKIVSALAVVALMAPSVASAATAAGALSVKSAAVQPVRAAAKPGKTKAASGTLIAVLAAAAVVGGIVIASDGSDSK